MLLTPRSADAAAPRANRGAKNQGNFRLPGSRADAAAPLTLSLGYFGSQGDLHEEKDKIDAGQETLFYIYGFVTVFRPFYGSIPFFGIELTGQTVVALRTFRLSTFHWLAIGLFSLFGVAVTYVREYTIMKSKERKVIVGKVIGELLEGLLVRYKEYAGRPRHERREFVKVVLRYIRPLAKIMMRQFPGYKWPQSS